MGNGYTFHQRTPIRIAALEVKPIKKVVCGASWCFAISCNGELYGWGHGDGGWLGVDMQRHNNLLRYSDAEEPSAAQPVPPSLPYSELTYTYSFESRVNILTPTLIDAYNGHSIRYIRCGADFSIISSTASGSLLESNFVSKSFQSSQLPEDIIRHCRLGRRDAVEEYVKQEYHKGDLNMEARDEKGVRILVHNYSISHKCRILCSFFAVRVASLTSAVFWLNLALKSMQRI